VARVIIGMDPHKRSATIEVMDGRGRVLAQGRYGTDSHGYRVMLAAGGRFPQRVWAVEGCNSIGRHVAQRLVADGETVVDVPAKLSARVRVFDTGQGRKTDPVDAHSVAVVAVRTTGLRRVTVDDDTVARRLMVGRRDWLGRAGTDTVNRLHALLLDLVPGGAKKHLSALQARTILAGVRPRDVVGRTRRQLASELITELAVIDKKIKQSNAALTDPDRGHRQQTATAQRDRPLRGGPAAGRHRRRQPVRQPQPLRVLERHRTAGRLLGRSAPPSSVPGWESAHQPGPAYHGRRPATPRHRGPRILPA